jgi:hypothetical protein
MQNAKNAPTPATTRIIWLTGIACVACCAVPLLGITIGSATIAGLAMYSEKAAAAVAAIGVGVLIFKRMTRKAGPACNLQGNCAPDKAAAKAREGS